MGMIFSTAMRGWRPERPRMRFLLQQYDLRAQAGGGLAHSRQFVRNLRSQGHSLWGWAPAVEEEPAVTPLRSRLDFALAWSFVDCAYYRVTHQCPDTGMPRLPSLLGGAPLRVWEFNTIPEFASCVGATSEAIEVSKRTFRERRGDCDLAVCVSEAIADYVREELGITRTVVATNASDPSVFFPEVTPVSQMAPFAGACNVCWLGSWELSWHRMDLVREAAEILAAKRGGARPIHFHVLGGKVPEDSACYGPHFHFHGHVPYEDLPGWLAGMTMGLVTYGEGPGWYSSPLKFFDYLAMGLPVISLRQNQIERIFAEEGLSRLLVKDYSAPLLADRIDELVSDSALITQCRERFPTLVRERYNWSAVTARIATEVATLRDAQDQSSGGGVRRARRRIFRALHRCRKHS